jgi:hypothetical protein
MFPMRELVLVGALYLVTLGAFSWLGGIVAAGGAIQDWGRRASEV